MYRGGNGVELDADKADAFLRKSVPLYQAACDGGALEWCMNLGFVYEHGYLGQPELDARRSASIKRPAKAVMPTRA